MALNKDDYGRIAYTAYCHSTNWKSIRGDDLPLWDTQEQRIKDAWIAAAMAVSKSELLQALNELESVMH